MSNLFNSFNSVSTLTDATVFPVVQDGQQRKATGQNIKDFIDAVIPPIPTDVSEFNNDAGYLTSVNTATTTTAGIVIIGRNLTVTDDGTVSASAGTVVSETAPTDPQEGDQWWDSTLGKDFIYYNGVWVEMIPGAAGGGGMGPIGLTGPAGATGPQGASGATGPMPDLTTVTTHIIPSADNTYDLGSPTKQWRHVYTAGGSIYLDNIKLTNVNGKFVAKTVINPGEENEADDPEDSDATSEISGGANTGGISFDGTYIYPTVDGNNLTLEVYRQNGVEGAGLFLDGDNGIARLQAKKSFNREIGGTAKTFTAGEGVGIISVTFAPNSDLYQRELLSRLASKFDGNNSFEYNYQMPRVIVNSLTENIEANITNVIQSNPDRFDITVDQLPNSDPFTVNTLDIFYDFYNTVGFNVDTDTFGMSTDNDDITVRSGRDIDLLAADDILIKGGSAFDLEVRRNDNQDPVDGIQIKTIDDGENITNNWTFQFDGTLTLPGDLALPGGLATITTTNGGGDTEISTPGSITLHNSTGDWIFDNSGNLTLPVGGDILDSNGNSVLGGTTGDSNIWIQTFESDTPATDIPGSATSVEYDSDGNIIALFVHYYSDNSGNNYTSLAKFTSTGEKLWQVRYAGIGAVDGWGVAVDSQNSFIYVTAR